MKKKIIIFIVLSLFCALLAGCFSSSNADQNQYVGVKCIYDEDCQNGYACYFSQVYGRGSTESGPQQGDLQCHKKCNIDADCSKGMNCKEVMQFWGDAGGKIKMCFN